ncbi:right-handed parallel beta-helix repeat-containing protein [Microbacterium testaceum]|uniref:right-handed parallel beta-helix repeat-containing protein n=1 Tax=Microbacterium testaceum TaxID=2033 RepID=UPI00380807C6
MFQLAPVTYQGRFHAQVAGSADSRILLCGVAGSVFDGGDTEDGYALHLDGASYWDIRDVSIRGAQKGIVLDATSHTTLSDLRISDVGQEGLHLRANSSDNLVQRIRVERTGLVDPSFGEGVYVGSAQSNWCRYTSCQPDRSDRNTFEQLSISDTMAEAVDIKEGTSDGVVRDSTLTVSAQAVVDSVVDVKGSGWTLDANMVVGAVDAISVHVILPPWGSANVLVRNQLSPTSGGLGVHLVGAARAAANRVGCDNTTPEGVELTNIACA